MTSSLRLLTLGLAAVLCAFARADVQLVNLIDDSSPVVLSVRDLPALLKNGADSPWAKTWNDEQLRKFLAPLRSKMKIDHWDEQCKAETGYTVSELLEMAKGQLLVAMTSADVFDLGSDPDPSRIPVLIALELGGNTSKVAKIIADNDAKEHEVVQLEDYAGVQMHVYQKPADKGGAERFAWAMADGIWFLSPSKAVVQKAVDNLKNGRAKSPLGESERYLKIRKQAPDADFTLLCNIQAFYPALKLAAEKSAEKKKNVDIPPGVLMDALGLDALLDLYVCVTIAPEATQLNGALTCSEYRGMLKILAFNDGPVPQPVFVSEKWLNAGTACFSLPASYASLKELLAALNPMMAGMFQGKVKELNQQLGIDIERDLVGSLGSQLLSAKAMRTGSNPDVPQPLSEMDQLFAVSLDNAPAFTKSVEALKRMAGPMVEKMLQKREYLGQSIFTFVQPNAQPGQKGFSYAITPKYLFVAVGSPAILETAIQGLGGKQPTLWQKPEVKAALADVPANACSFEYQDNRALIGSMIETFCQIVPKFAGNSQVADDEEGGPNGKPVHSTDGPFDLSSKPDPAAISKYWSISTGYVWRDSHGLYFKSKVQHSK